MHILQKSITFALALEGVAEIVLQPSISMTYQNGIQTYAPETAGTPEIFPFGGIPHTRVAVLITVRLEDYTYTLIRQVDAIALVRCFRPIPIDEFDAIAQPLIL